MPSNIDELKQVISELMDRVTVLEDMVEELEGDLNYFKTESESKITTLNDVLKHIDKNLEDFMSDPERDNHDPE